MAKRAPVWAAISSSSAATSGPRMNCCEEHTLRTATSTSSRIVSYCAFRSSSGSLMGFPDPFPASSFRKGVVDAARAS